MKFKLFDFETYSDYGWEFFFQVFRFRKFALLDLTFQWDEYPATEFFPFLVVSMGPHHLFGFTFRWKAFEMSCDIIDAAPRNLEWYRRGESKYELID